MVGVQPSVETGGFFIKKPPAFPNDTRSINADGLTQTNSIIVSATPLRRRV